MPNTALNRTTQVLLTNKSGGNLNYGDVVVLDNTNANGFTTTTTVGLSTRGLGVILEPSGIANNASGMVAVGGWCPQVNLNTAAAVGQFIKSYSVAGQGTPHASPQVEGDFAVALSASATPPCNLFGSPNGPLSGVSAGSITTSGLTMTTARLLGRTTASTGAIEEITVSTGLSLSAGVLTASAGKVVQSVNTQTGSVATGTTTIPFDDTKPQNTEGDQYMSLSVTPTNASKNLVIDVLFVCCNSAANFQTIALFQDSTADALKANWMYIPAATAGCTIPLRHIMAAGTTSATTFKVRSGGHVAGTTTFNGQGGGRIFGGICGSGIVITEVAP